MNILDKSDMEDSFTRQEINEIAENHTDFHIRLNFIDYVEDEDVFKSIVTNDYSTRVCIKAMEQINDVDFLVDVCFNHPDVEVRLITLNRILNDSLLKNDGLSSFLENIIFNDPEYVVCKFALEHLTNQEALIKIADISCDEIISGIAISKITDEDILIDLALNNPHDFIRREAIDNPNLKDRDVLSEIILNDSNEFNRYWACGKITDKEYLLGLIFNKSFYHCLDYFTQFSNSTLFFKDIYENSEDDYHRQVAVHFINNSYFLEKISPKESNENIRFEIIKNKYFNNQKVIKNLLANENNPDILSEAILKADHINNDELMKFSQTNNPKILCHAVKKISHDDSGMPVDYSRRLDFLMEVILNESDKKIVFEAVDAMNDNFYLSKVVMQSNDREVKLKAINKIKTKDLLTFLIDYSLRSRIISFNQLFFESNLKHIALTENDSEIRQIAISKINDISFLEELSNEHNEDSIIAKDMLGCLFEGISCENLRNIKKLTYNSNKEVSQIAQMLFENYVHDDNSVQEIQNISDINVLKNIAVKCYDYKQRCAAENRIEKILFHIRLDEINCKINQEKLKNIVEDDSFTPYIRYSALLKINDCEFLNQFDEKFFNIE